MSRTVKVLAVVVLAVVAWKLFVAESSVEVEYES